MDELVFTVLAVALGVAAAIVHILPAVIEIRKTQVIATVGAVVHSAWLAALFFAGAELDVITLCFMASLLLYCFIAWLQYRRSPEWREHRGQRAAEAAAEAKKRADRKAAEATTPKKAEIAESEAKIAEPKAEIAECDSITEPEAEIVKPEAEIAKPEAEIAEPKAEIAEPKAEIAECEAEIAEPKAEIAEYKAEIAEFKEACEI